jgi:hypothetical protein
MTLTRALKGFLLFISGLILAPLAASFVTGPILPLGRIVMSVAIAAVISAPVYFPLFRAAMSDAAKIRLEQISLNALQLFCLSMAFCLASHSRLLRGARCALPERLERCIA